MSQNNFNANSWQHADYPPFIIPLTKSAKMTRKDGTAIPAGTIFFIESWTSPPFGMEGFFVMFRLNSTQEIEFLGYEEGLRGHMNECMMSASKMEDYWKSFWARVDDYQGKVEVGGKFKKAFLMLS